MNLNEAILTLIQAGHQNAGSKITTVERDNERVLSFISQPDGSTHLNITDLVLNALPTPQRRVGNFTALALNSLVSYVNRYAEENRSVVFADTVRRKLTAILNFHEPTKYDPPQATDDGDEAEPVKSRVVNPQWGDFRAEYSFPLSRQWNTWKGADNKPMKQADLAHFIEDNIRDIADPGTTPIPASMQLIIDRLKLTLGSPSRLLEVARGLEIRSTEKVRNAINTDTGEQVVIYEQEHAGGGNPTVHEVKVPTAFLLTIPVFQNDAPYLLLVRLRYRKVDASVLWLINIQAADAALDDAFERGCAQVTEFTNLPLMFGEAPPKAAAR